MREIKNYIILILSILILLQIFNNSGGKYIKLKGVSKDDKERLYDENIFSYNEDEYVNYFFEGITQILKEDNDIRYKYIDKDTYDNHLQLYSNNKYNKDNLFISSSYKIIEKYKYMDGNRYVIEAVLFEKQNNMSIPLKAEYYYIEKKDLFDYKLVFNTEFNKDIYDDIME